MQSLHRGYRRKAEDRETRGQGDANVEVRYKKEFQDLVADYFHLLLHYYCQGEQGIPSLKRYEDSVRKKMEVRLDSPGNES
ncbi:MAG: hypothetical protein LUQ13_01215 [Methanomicrobiales archaeon]|nr:hypothetical protein [Methanomicrobiales archaeon]